MTPNRRERTWPVPDAIHQIRTAIIRENNNETNLLAISFNRGYGEVSLGDRDEAVRRLKFLKFWLNLPANVFFTACNVLDRFLTKMKVQRRYLPCLVISCLNIATKLHRHKIDPKNLVTISQSKFSIKDLERMSDIVYRKLDLGVGMQLINVFNYVDQFLGLLEAVAVQFGITQIFHLMLQESMLMCHLEVIICNSQCASLKPAIVALALIQIQFERFLSCEVPSKSSYYSIEMLRLLTSIVDLQLICLIVPAEFTSCHKKLMEVLKDYDNYTKLGSLVRFKWRPSRPMYNTKNYWCEYNTLPTIWEE